MSSYESRYLSLGEFLKKKRLESGLTQSKIANDLKITPQMVCNWENGRCGPPADLLIELASVLSINKEELLQNILMSNEQFYKRKLKISSLKKKIKRTSA